MSTLTGKVALITGASRGIGKSIALELTKCGASVIINYKKDEKGALETLEKVEKLGGYGEIHKSDISKYNEAKELIEYIVKKFGKIDILVNNAGISKIGLFIDMEEDDWDNMMSVNLKGVFNCTHNVVKHMIKNKSGRIINISSMWGNIGASCEVIYSASKGGINSFTRALAKELGPSNITVNAIAPGVIDTDMNKSLTEDAIKDLKSEIPAMRLGKGKDVAKVVTFLCNDEIDYVTGQIITVDGGMC
ncbi:elongation factor P 5-aminopentanone reductase [Clostridium oceanicum]|uniref:SDR family oxidoreductase n=1 Tax=Clostridium oceanicum TaxID=1543 RepID=A0ABP3UNM3_9CLOT